MKKYYSFIYMDNQLIRNLYSQVFDDVVESTIEHSHELSEGIAASGKILDILSSSVDYAVKGATSESKQQTLTDAKRTQLLINHWGDGRDRIQEFIEKHQPFYESKYFVGWDTFFLSDIYDKKTGQSLFSENQEANGYIRMNNNSIIILEAGNTEFIRNMSRNYADTDDFYSLSRGTIEKYGIMMHMSNSKMQKDLRHLTWEIKRAKHFNLYIFGEVVKSGGIYYKLIPFAVWQ